MPASKAPIRPPTDGASAPAATAASGAEPEAGPSLSDGPPPSLQGEWASMCLLLTLYFLQGIPIGLASSIPLLLSSRGVSYADQALYSFSSYPYSLKWLWAPVVDAVHTERWGLGKRKSWVVPCQLVTGMVMMVVASRVDWLLPSGGSGAVDVPGLLAAFLVLYFLVATQDIAVDGWALELLRPENVGYASTANTVGQGVGIQVAFSIFLALDSPDVCNTYLRPALGLPPQDVGMLSLGGFLWGWGAVFLVVTLAVWALKRESAAPAPALQPTGSPAPPAAAASAAGAEAAGLDADWQESEEAGLIAPELGGGLRERKKSNSRSGSEEERRLGSVKTAASGSAAPAVSAAASSGGSGAAAKAASGGGSSGSSNGSASASASPGASTLTALHESYADFFRVCFLPNILSLAIVLLTFKAGFASVDATTTFVLQERGVPKETLAFIDTISFPLQLGIQARASPPFPHPPPKCTRLTPRYNLPLPPSRADLFHSHLDGRAKGAGHFPVGLPPAGSVWAGAAGHGVPAAAQPLPQPLDHCHHPHLGCGCHPCAVQCAQRDTERVLYGANVLFFARGQAEPQQWRHCHDAAQCPHQPGQHVAQAPHPVGHGGAEPEGLLWSWGGGGAHWSGRGCLQQRRGQRGVQGPGGLVRQRGEWVPTGSVPGHSLLPAVVVAHARARGAPGQRPRQWVDPTRCAVGGRRLPKAAEGCRRLPKALRRHENSILLSYY